MVVAFGRKGGHLHQAAELAVGHEQARPGGAVAHLGQQRRQKADVVGVAVGVGVQGQGQTAVQGQGDQGPAPQQTPGGPAQRLEAFGHALDGLAVQDDHGPAIQALGGCGRRLGGEGGA